ncbi:hypothetical protein ACHAXR_009940 [Thalassiosira sp. AJA248-18]
MVALHKKMTALTATNEFWHSPINLSSSSDDCAASSHHDHEQAMSNMAIPAAHHQLLSGDQTSFENLKGYDHNQDVVSYDSSSDGGGSSSSSFCSRQKLSSVKQQGGGSWLLGFARINEKPSSSVDPVIEEDVPPGLVRDDSSLESDEDLSSDDGESDLDSDDDSSLSSTPTKTKRRRRAGVAFSTTVTIQPIPHSCTLTAMQRRKMYSTSFEVRQNKIRNKREYRYDGYDWRNVTEEWEMGVDMVTGELVHPAHEYGA